MPRSRTIAALLWSALFGLALATPAAAAKPVGEAWGNVTWALRSGEVPGIVSDFYVRDGRPFGASSRGDSGWYRLTRPDPILGTLTLRVECVRVDAGWAEFAGVVTEASGVYVKGEVFLVSVLDGGPNEAGDEIGMKSHGFDLASGCAAALDLAQFGRKGVIAAGDIAVRVR